MVEATPTYLTREKAEALAKQLNFEDDMDGWIYEAQPVAPGSIWYKVVAKDETGAEVGPL